VQEHLDYDIVQSTNPEFRKAIVRVNVFRDHRQTVQVSHSSSMSSGQILCPLNSVDYHVQKDAH